MSVTLLLATLAVPSHARPPKRAIPEAVLHQLADLELRFEDALALDCSEERCTSTGCVYVDHAVVDRPRKSALPGLYPDEGPGSVEPQAWLTKAQCAYTHEPAASPEDVKTLTRRLQSRVTTSWTSVSVTAKPLDELPDYFRTAPTAEDEVEDTDPDIVVEDEPLTVSRATEELWAALVPHVFWMLGVALTTVAIGVLLWAWRRLGVETLEEKMLAAELTATPAQPADAAPAHVESDADPEVEAFVEQERARWTTRLARLDAGHPDPALTALVRDRLRAGDLPLLARAVLTFPDHLPAAFPSGGDVAPAKLALADYLQTVDEDALPTEAELFAVLHRHAAAATLATQADAEVVRSLRDDFGPAGLTDRIRPLHPRLGGLLFAMSPPEARQELVRLLPSRVRAAMAGQLLKSNRLDPLETTRLFDVLRAPGGVGASSHDHITVSDRGAALDSAPTAVSELLTSLPATTQTHLIDELLVRTEGSAPAWTRGVLTPSMLLTLPQEARSDLFLGVSTEAVAAWLGTLPADSAAELTAGLPDSLRTSLRAVAQTLDADALQTRAAEGRRALSSGLIEQLTRLGRPFESALRGGDATA